MHNLRVSTVKYSLPNLYMNLTMLHEFCLIFIRNTVKQGCVSQVMSLTFKKYKLFEHVLYLQLAMPDERGQELSYRKQIAHQLRIQYTYGTA